jgi:hypothetical protein
MKNLIEIRVKLLGPTTHRGSRLKVTYRGIPPHVYPRDYELAPFDQAASLASGHALNAGHGPLLGWTEPDDATWVFLCLPSRPVLP